MGAVPHLPALRLGRAYESLETYEVKDHRTAELRAVVSSVNAGIIRRDLGDISAGRAALNRFTCAELIGLSVKAGDMFLHGTLPLGDRGHTQTADDYVRILSGTSGLPHVMVRRNMARIHHALTHMGEVLHGLSRGLDLDDKKTPYCFFPATTSLGLVMPSNSPSVNSLWLPAVALRIPVIIKPGRDEPWTPYRLMQAFIAVGVPAEAFGFYPTDHEGADTILRLCGRSLVFGDQSTTDKYAGNPAIQVHGPGHSKVLIGIDQVARWPEFIDMLVDSIAANGGRSCLCASAIVVPSHGDEIAGALAQRLGPIAPLPAEDENARLSAFANPKMAGAIDAAIEQALPGAVEVTAQYRNGPRLVNFEGGTYLRPTIVRCNSFAHPLANQEYLFPYASVIEVPQGRMLEQIGPSLVVTAVTQDERWIEQLMGSAHIDRLNIGAISTMNISWNQPHEGNLFEFLYRRRAFARA